MASSYDTWLGIDFSGNRKKWGSKVSAPNVWVATVTRRGAERPQLLDVIPVQELSGPGVPFERLRNLLKAGEFAAAAIDAPFSLPENYVPRGGHPKLLAQLPAPFEGEPFPRGSALISMAQRIGGPISPTKPTRETERCWLSQNVNTRSSLWNGARPGAPMTAACLALLACCNRPIWPWSEKGPGLLVEAFPAAQLRVWEMQHTGYSAKEPECRRRIVGALENRIQLGKHRTKLISFADALDAVLAAFAGVAVTDGKSAPQGTAWKKEGWIATQPKDC